LQTHGPYHEHNRIIQEHTKVLVIAQHRVGDSTLSTLRGAKIRPTYDATAPPL